MNITYVLRKIISLTVCASLLFSAVPVGAIPDVPRDQLDDSLRPPAKIGRIATRHIQSGAPLVIHINDLHCNPQAQKHISELIAFYSEKYPGVPILAEGAPQGPVDLALLRALPDDVRAPVFSYLLARGIMGGGEYAALNGEEERLFGLEERETYGAAVMLYQSLLHARRQLTSELTQFDSFISQTSARELPRRVRRIERFVNQQERDDAWYAKLPSLCAEARIPLYRYPTLSLYIHGLKLSKSLHLKRVSSQAEVFVRALKGNLPYKEYAVLMQALGNDNDRWPVLGRYFSASAPSVQKSHPDLAAFLTSQSLMRAINPVTLHDEEWALVREICDSVPVTQRERDAFALVRLSRLLIDGIHARLTANGFAAYVAEKERLDVLLDECGAKKRFPQATGVYLAGLVEQYYRLNLKRDQIFTTAVVNAAQQGAARRDAIIVITGGFHRGLEARLTAQGLSYVAVMPGVSQSADSAVYERLMTGTAVPLDATRSALAPLLIAAGLAQGDADRHINILSGVVGALQDNGTLTPEHLTEVINDWIKTHPKLQAILSVTTQENICVVEGNFSGGTKTVQFVVSNGRVVRADAGGIPIPDNGPSPHATALGNNIIDLVLDIFYTPKSQLAKFINIMLSHESYDIAPAEWENPGTLRKLLEDRGDIFADIINVIFAFNTSVDHVSQRKKLEKSIEAAYLDMIQSKTKVTLVVSRNPDLLLANDRWALATFQPKNGKLNQPAPEYTLYVHEAFFKYLEGRPEAEQDQLIDALARHEVEEYAFINLNNYCTNHSRYKAFSDYLMDVFKTTRVPLIPTYDSFHRFIEQSNDRANSDLRILMKYAQQTVDTELILKYLEKNYPLDNNKSILLSAMQVLRQLNDLNSEGAAICDCISAARMVAAWGGDINAVVSTLLHSSTNEQLLAAGAERKLPAENLESVMHKLRTIREIASIPFVGDPGVSALEGESTLDNYMKMVVMMTGGDFGTFLSLLAKDLSDLQRETASERQNALRNRIMSVYLPLAMRLDYQNLANDLRDAVFSSQEPQAFEEYLASIEDKLLFTTYHTAQLQIETRRRELEARLQTKFPYAGVLVKARLKGVFSVYEKTTSDRNQTDGIEDISDLFGLAIIVKDPRFRQSVEDVVVAYLKENNFEGLNKNNNEIVRSTFNEPEKGFTRVKFSCAEVIKQDGATIHRPFEVVLYDQRNYEQKELGVWDEYTIEYGKPQYIYKMGVPSAVERNEAEGVFWVTADIGGRISEQRFRADNVRFTGGNKDHIFQLFDAYRSNEYVVVRSDSKMSVLQVPTGSTMVDIAAHVSVSPLLEEIVPGLLAETDEHTDEQSRFPLERSEVLTGMRFRIAPYEVSLNALGNPQTVRGRLMMVMAGKGAVERDQAINLGKLLLPDLTTDNAALNDRLLQDTILRCGLKDLNELYLAVGSEVLPWQFLKEYIDTTTKFQAVCVRIEKKPGTNIEVMTDAIRGEIEEYYNITGQPVVEEDTQSDQDGIRNQEQTSSYYIRFAVEKKTHAPNPNGFLEHNIKGRFPDVAYVRLRTVVHPQHTKIVPPDPVFVPDSRFTVPAVPVEYDAVRALLHAA